MNDYDAIAFLLAWKEEEDELWAAQREWMIHNPYQNEEEVNDG